MWYRGVAMHVFEGTKTVVGLKNKKPRAEAEPGGSERVLKLVCHDQHIGTRRRINLLENVLLAVTFHIIPVFSFQ